MLDSGLPPSVIVYSAVMACCGAEGRWEEALQLLAAMKAERLAVDVPAVNIAISACARGRARREALLLHEQLRAGCSSAEGRRGGQMLTERTWGATIGAMYKGGQWRKAAELVGEMRRDGLAPNLACYTPALAACADAAEWRPALELWESLLRDGITPDALAAGAALDACLAGRVPQSGLAVVELL